MRTTNKDLLNLELKNPTSSSLDSTLLVCPNKDLPPQKSASGEKLVTSSIPESEVLGKVRDFLGVMTNKRLQTDAEENSGKDYDIEALTGKEKEYIEMDLILGVADLHTPEAVAAAESAMVSSGSSQQVLDLAGTRSGSDTESSEDDSEDDDEEMTENGVQDSKSQKTGSSRSGKRKKRPNIIELL
ncbi:hypothetical protein MKX01_007687 [Papaver californicum]|nr:hypothetical protein MKX01_007687 [Papaver californicum]